MERFFKVEGEEMRLGVMVVMLVLTLAAAGAWAWSYRKTWTADFEVSGRRVHVVSARGAVHYSVFAMEMEEPGYHEGWSSYAAVVLPLAAGTVLAGWWWRRGRKRASGRGFPVAEEK